VLRLSYHSLKTALTYFISERKKIRIFPIEASWPFYDCVRAISERIAPPEIQFFRKPKREREKLVSFSGSNVRKRSSEVTHASSFSLSYFARANRRTKQKLWSIKVYYRLVTRARVCTRHCALGIYIEKLILLCYVLIIVILYACVNIKRCIYILLNPRKNSL
jgi:hypothetical protein